MVCGEQNGFEETEGWDSNYSKFSTVYQQLQSELEFELRLQDFVDLMRNQKLNEAMNYAKRFLAPHKATHFNAIRQAAGLLAASSRSHLMEHPQYKVPSVNFPSL